MGFATSGESSHFFRRLVRLVLDEFMTMGSFIVRNAFRNKRRSLLTMISISFSLLLLTLMICIWRSFYIDQVAPEAARRLIIRDRVYWHFFCPRTIATRFAAYKE